jgi:hypothetical protein
MKKRILYLFTLLMLTAGPAVAQYDWGFTFSKAGSAGYQFLKIGTGAREVGMGEAMTAVTDDVGAIHWNPAGLAKVDRLQVGVHHNEWLVGSTHSSVALALPVRRIVVGVSLLSFGIESFEETTVTEPDGTGRMVKAGDVMAGLTISRRFTERLVIGGQIKYVHETLDTYSHGNVLMDIGTQYDTGFRNLRLGFSLQHFGPDMKVAEQTFRTPLLFRLGAADEVIDIDNVKLTASAELVHPTDNVEWVNTGLELTLVNSFVVRGGYRFKADQMNATVGFGLITPDTAFGRLKLDYAWAPTGTVFANVHRFSLRFNL